MKVPIFFYHYTRGFDRIDLVGTAFNDGFQFNSLATDYSINGLAGADIVSFVTASRTVINMDNHAPQYVLPGQVGTLRMVDTIETVNGSAFADVITGSIFGTTINAGLGADTIRLTGGVSVVNTFGNSNTIVMTGFGTYTVNLGGALPWQASNFNVVNAAALSPFAGLTTVNAWGNNNTVLGGQNALTAAITGNYATISAAAAAPASVVTATVTGNYAKVVTGFANDVVTITGSFATVTTGAGNDVINLTNSFTSRVYAGAGDDDIAVLGAASTNNFLYGEDGNDFLSVYATRGVNYIYCGAGNDFVAGSDGGRDYIYGMSGDNILIGFKGSDYIYGGSGTDLMISGSPTIVPAAPLIARGLVTAWATGFKNAANAAVVGLGASVADGVQDYVIRGAGFGNAFGATVFEDVFTPVPSLGDFIF